MYLCLVHPFLFILTNVNLGNVTFAYRRRTKSDNGSWYNCKENGARVEKWFESLPFLTVYNMALSIFPIPLFFYLNRNNNTALLISRANVHKTCHVKFKFC